MESYRVVLANEPRLLRGLLSRVLQQAPGVLVVGQEMDKAKLSSMVAERQADWVIVSLWQNGNLPAFLQALVAEHPSLCLLGMAADGSRARTWCQERGEQSLNSLTLDTFITTLRHPGP
jgi:DNA-binding NarL/FixJ family response regulator